MLKNKLKINLQLFAEGDPTPGDTKPPAGGEPPKTFTQEDVDKLLQSETDKRVTDALKTARSNWEKEYTDKLQKEKQEAERLAKLTEEEKRKELIKQKDEELANKEKELRVRELKLDTINALSEKQLPVQFADFLMGADAESTHENIKKFTESFQTAIETAVTERLKGAPPKGGGAAKTELQQLEEQLGKATKLEEKIMIRRKIDELKG